MHKDSAVACVLEVREDRLMHGWLRNSFGPPRPIRDLRDLTRSRARLAQWQGPISHRMQKVLEDANIKWASVASDVRAHRAAGCSKR